MPSALAIPAAPVETCGMAKASDEWKVRAHGPLLTLAENLLWVQGTVPNMSLKRTMVVVRLSDGRLVIHNGIALEAEQMVELERFGTPAFLIVPNGIHRLDAAAYKKRYPALRVLAPAGSRKRVEELVAVDGVYEDFPNDDVLRLETLNGMAQAEGALIAQSSDGATVILNDCMFNMDRKRDPLGFLFTTLMGSAPGPRVSRLCKMMLIKDKKALRADFERYAALPDLVRVIVAHEKVASGAEARAALLQAATYL